MLNSSHHSGFVVVTFLCTCICWNIYTLLLTANHLMKVVLALHGLSLLCIYIYIVLYLKLHVLRVVLSVCMFSNYMYVHVHVHVVSKARGQSCAYQVSSAATLEGVCRVLHVHVVKCYLYWFVQLDILEPHRLHVTLSRRGKYSESVIQVARASKSGLFGQFSDCVTVFVFGQ